VFIDLYTQIIMIYEGKRFSLGQPKVHTYYCVCATIIQQMMTVTRVTTELQELSPLQFGLHLSTLV